MKKAAKGFLIAIAVIELLICIYLAINGLITGFTGIILLSVLLYHVIKKSDDIDYKRIYLHLSADFLTAVVIIVLVAVTRFYLFIIIPPVILLVATTIDAFRHCKNRKSAVLSLLINPNLYYVILLVEAYIRLCFFR